MAIKRQGYTKPLPAGAELFTRDGKRWARWTDKRGKAHEAPTNDEGTRLRLKSKTHNVVVGGRRVGGAPTKGAARIVEAEAKNRAALGTLSEHRAYDSQGKRPLSAHIDDYKAHLRAKRNSERCCRETPWKVQRVLVDICGFGSLRDIDAVAVERALAQLRDTEGVSVQTSNHHLVAVRQFLNWAVRNKRLHENPVRHLTKLDVKTDRRHDRRAIAPEEFQRLVNAALEGPPVESISGPDRAMLYILAAWTGLRRGELGSLTTKSFDLGDAPTVTVEASYSKRRRRDRIELHPAVADLLRAWVQDKERAVLLWPVSGNVPGGVSRKTHKMMRVDLGAARQRWLGEATNQDERDQRAASDFLAYHSEDGTYADFHANRHTFITAVAMGNSAVAQDLARHGDPRLTALYTHVPDQARRAAIEALPAPPENRGKWPRSAYPISYPTLTRHE